MGYQDKLKPLGSASSYQSKLTPIGTPQTVAAPEQPATTAPAAPAQPQTDYLHPFVQLATGHPLQALGSAVSLGAQGIMNAPGDIASAFKGGFQRGTEGMRQIQPGAGPMAGLEGGLKVGSGIASMVTAPVAPLFKPIGSLIQQGQQAVENIPAVQQAAQKLPNIDYQRYSGMANDVSNITGSLALGSQIAPKVGPAIKGTASTIDAGTSKLLQGKTPVDYYNKAVKPPNAGMASFSDIKAKSAKVDTAINAIVQNKNVLKLATEDGDVKAGQLPTTRLEHSQAIDQVKNSIFQQYDALAKTAGDKGAQVPLEPVVGALKDVIDNKALQLSNPDVVDYAAALGKRLKGETLDPKTVQDLIQNYNSKLQAFYRNPTYETATRAAVDAGVVAKLRETLDNVITNATGEQYSALKQQYGALKAIEKDAARAAMQQAKQIGTNASGLGKYIDVFSGGDMVSGVLSLNPAMFAKGAAQKSIMKLFQWYNSPDRAIEHMYKAAENTKPTAPTMPKQLGPAQPAVPPPQPTTPVSSSKPTTSLLQDLKGGLKDQRGMIKNPFYKEGTKMPKQIADLHPDDIHLMEKFIDNARIKQPMTAEEYAQAEKLAEQQGISLDKGLNAVANEFEKVLKGTKAGKDTMPSQIGGSNDPRTSLPAAIKNLETSGTDWDMAIKAGDIPKEKIYQKEGVFTPEAADHVVSDLAGKMNMFKKGIGDQFQKSVDMSNPTRENLVKQAQDYLKKNSSQAGFFNPVAMTDALSTAASKVNPASLLSAASVPAKAGVDYTRQPDGTREYKGGIERPLAGNVYPTAKYTTPDGKKLDVVNGNLVFFQHDPQWKSSKTGVNCAPTAMATIISNQLGRVVTPDDIAQRAEKSGAFKPKTGSNSAGMVYDIPEQYGLEASFFKSISQAEEFARSHPGTSFYLDQLGATEEGTGFSDHAHAVALEWDNKKSAWQALDPNDQYLLPSNTKQKGMLDMQRTWTTKQLEENLAIPIIASVSNPTGRPRAPWNTPSTAEKTIRPLANWPFSDAVKSQ